MDCRFHPLALAAVAIVIAAPAPAQDAEVQGVISDQLQAFVARDAERAFSHASPMMQGMYRSPEMFSGMVAQGYPMVFDNAQVRFGGVEVLGATMVQTVYITDAGGRFHALKYEMIQIEGDWKINGVELLEAPTPSV
ncbi:MAG: DUF4864 domain-containing protein [Celeribacter sp.]|jgi:hypothetical protein